MVITIGGEYGSGSKAVARLVAEHTGYRFCDDEIVQEATKEYGIDTKSDMYLDFDESVGKSSIKELIKLSKAQKKYGKALGSLAVDITPLDKNIEQSLKAVLSKFADEGNCIIGGRCANYFLRGRKNVISIFFKDSEEAKLARIEEALECDTETAEKIIKETDTRRGEYYEFFTGEKWNSQENYNYVWNTGAIGVEKTAKLMESLIAIMDAE